MPIISLKTPFSVRLDGTAKQVLTYMKEGYKSKEIRLQLEFQGDPELIKMVADEFQVLKNHVAFKLNPPE